MKLVLLFVTLSIVVALPISKVVLAQLSTTQDCFSVKSETACSAHSDKCAWEFDLDKNTDLCGPQCYTIHSGKQQCLNFKGCKYEYEACSKDESYDASKDTAKKICFNQSKTTCTTYDKDCMWEYDMMLDKDLCAPQCYTVKTQGDCGRFVGCHWQYEACAKDEDFNPSTVMTTTNNAGVAPTSLG